MRYQEFKSLISNSNPSQWSYDDELGLYVFLEDVRITIELLREEENEDFYEEWVTLYSDSVAYKKIFNLRYNGSVIERFYSVAVDGFRAYIPYPRRVDMSITQEQYTIGSIINRITGQNFDEYLSRASISVEEVVQNQSFSSPYNI